MKFPLARHVKLTAKSSHHKWEPRLARIGKQGVLHGSAKKKTSVSRKRGSSLGRKMGSQTWWCIPLILERLKQEGQEFKASLDHIRTGSSSGYRDPATEESLR